MTSVNTSLYLDASGQAQLAKLKAANQIPLTRIDSKVSQVKLKQPTLNTVKTEVDELKSAIQRLRDAPEAEKADAITKFVKEFNDVQKQLTATTSKEGTLRSVGSVRDARSGLRDPFSDITVLNELRSAGVLTTREGLQAGTVTAVEFSDEVLSKLESTVDMVANRMAAADSSLSSQIERLTDERERVQKRVDLVNVRTERSFLQYYQLLQQMNQAMSSATSGMGF